MDDDLKEELQGVDQAFAEKTANLLIEQHGLVKLVSDWNAGEPESSLIANSEHLKEALDIRFPFGALETRSNVYTPPFEADIKFRLCVEVCMDCALQSVIEATFPSALQRILTRWARQTLTSKELRANSPAPFQGEAEWLRWSVDSHFHRWPSRNDKEELEQRPELVLCSPEGRRLVPEAAEKALATYALLENIDLAWEYGWLQKAIWNQ